MKPQDQKSEPVLVLKWANSKEVVIKFLEICERYHNNAKNVVHELRALFNPQIVKIVYKKEQIAYYNNLQELNRSFKVYQIKDYKIIL